MSLYVSASRSRNAPIKQDDLSESFKGKGQWQLAERRKWMTLGLGVTAVSALVQVGSSWLESTHFSGLLGNQVEQIKEAVVTAGETAGAVTVGVAVTAACIGLAAKAVSYLRNRQTPEAYIASLPPTHAPVPTGLGQQLLDAGLGRLESSLVAA